MTDMFTPAMIGKLKVRNRFVRSATHEGMADSDGFATPELEALLGDLAKGRVGLVITGHAYVSPEGKASFNQLACDRDECIPSLTRLADAVHAHDMACCLQIAHGGAFALQLDPADRIGPSIAHDTKGEQLCQEMAVEDIDRIVQAFGEGARRAKESGYDAVQIHAAHGYLLSQTLSPYFNKREDEYGGTLEQRARMLLEIIQAIRDRVGSDYPVLIKMNSDDFLDPGFTAQECLLLCRRLENMGVDAIELSGGTLFSGKNIPIRAGTFDSPDSQAWYRETAKAFKAERGIPLLLVGGIRDLSTAQELVNSSCCDFVSLSRPLIREPHLVKRWQEGDTRPATCVSDNLCLLVIRKGEQLYCLTETRERAKKEHTK